MLVSGDPIPRGNGTHHDFVDKFEYQVMKERVQPISGIQTAPIMLPNQHHKRTKFISVFPFKFLSGDLAIPRGILALFVCGSRSKIDTDQPELAPLRKTTPACYENATVPALRLPTRIKRGRVAQNDVWQGECRSHDAATDGATK